MSKLYEDLCIRMGGMMPNENLSYISGCAYILLEFIDSHPETLERRRRDFEAGKMRGIWELIQLEGASQIENMPPNIDDYLAAEKGEK